MTLNDNGVINNGGANSTVLTSNLQFVVTSQNDAPVLGNITPVLSVDEDQSLGSNTGTTIATLIANGSITEAKDAVNPGLDDDDTPVEAIAITGTSVSNGTFEFSHDNGAFESVGSVSASQSLLLEATDKLRFRPDADFFGAAGTFTFRAWDQRSVSGSSTASAAGTKVPIGTPGGTSSFSSNERTANITVDSVQDAPTATIPNLTDSRLTVLEDAGAQTINGFARP